VIFKERYYFGGNFDSAGVKTPFIRKHFQYRNFCANVPGLLEQWIESDLPSNFGLICVFLFGRSV
jgi:hypothetical protein